MISYTIHIGNIDYACTLRDSAAKIVWEKQDKSVVFRKRLDGKFSLNRSGNEILFDLIFNFSYIDKGELSVTDYTGSIVSGTFRKKDLTISEDKCIIDIKFQADDEYSCIDKIAEEEVNILENSVLVPSYIIEVSGFVTEVEYAYTEGGTWYPYHWNEGAGWATSPNEYLIVPEKIFCPYSGVILDNCQTWTLIQQDFILQGIYDPNDFNIFFIKNQWVREVIKVPRVDPNIPATPPTVDMDDCNQNAWVDVGYEIISGIVHDKYAREIVTTDWVSHITGQYQQYFTRQSDCAFTSATIQISTAKKLSEVITYILSKQTCFSSFESIFFKSTDNPISHKDLSWLMIAQKSDCIYEYDTENKIYRPKSDPATIGKITFNQLMEMLQTMFNVYWAVDSAGNFRIEHKYYWDNNESYSPVPNPIVGIDLTTYYPQSLYGTKEYTFESNIPLREKFSFMEAWNTDFIGLPIHYKDYLEKGDDLNYSADLITTDLDPRFFNNDASKDGFCLFHIDKTEQQSPPLTFTFYKTIAEVGLLSGKQIPNAHLSFANLHDAYWKYDRYLPKGNMNGADTEFTVRPNKYQKSITFPYCFGDFNPNYQIKTGLGVGIVRSAEFSFKTNWITVELMYRDNN